MIRATLGCAFLGGFAGCDLPPDTAPGASSNGPFLLSLGCEVCPMTDGGTPDGGTDAGPEGGTTSCYPAPCDGASNVAPNGDFHAEFDGPLDPASVRRATVRLESGGNAVTGDVWYDPVHWTAHVQPTAPLAAGLQYRIVVTSDIQGLDGIALRGARSATFTTGATASPTAACDGDFLTKVLPFFHDNCVSSCHASMRCPGGAGCGPGVVDPQPPEGMALDACGLGVGSAWAGTTVVGVPSTEWNANGRAWLRIDPGRPEWSYLVYKLVGDVPGLVGEPMPRLCLGGAYPCLTREQIDPIACWIRLGAAIPDPVCGNGAIECGEACDPPDGTTCDASCQNI